MADLPDRAPSRTLRPEQWPKPAASGPRLRALGVDPDDLAALVAFALARGWGYRVAGTGRRHLAAVSVPGYRGEWAGCSRPRGSSAR